VKSVSGDVVTVSTRTGSDVQVTVTPSTRVTKTVSGSVSDLASGMNVRVVPTSGSSATASSVTASSISEVPAGAAGGGGRFAGFGGFGARRAGSGTSGT
jgi:hypothetical protein